MAYQKILAGAIALLIAPFCFSQLAWTKVDSLYGPLPAGVHVYRSIDSIGGKPSIAYYVEAGLKNRALDFTTEAHNGVRHTPTQYYRQLDSPLLVVNSSFFDVKTGVNINTVVKDGKLVAWNRHSIPGHGKDTLLYHHPLGGALGISKHRKADVAWLYTDSTLKYPVAFETKPYYYKDSLAIVSRYYFVPELHHLPRREKRRGILDRWKMQTAIGGGPVLLQKGGIAITNNEEYRFPGKAINDRHPRTSMGYTRDGRLIVMVIQGRFPGIAEGADLVQEATILRDLGYYEALNLDGGGSSCLLVNGKETIRPSDKEGERPVPAVFIIKKH